MPDPMALVLRLSDKWLLKNQNFRGKGQSDPKVDQMSS